MPGVAPVVATGGLGDARRATGPTGPACEGPVDPRRIAPEHRPEAAMHRTAPLVHAASAPTRAAARTEGGA